MAFVAKTPLNTNFAIGRQHINPLYQFSALKFGKSGGNSSNRRELLVMRAINSVQPVVLAFATDHKNPGISIMVNGCTGKMGKAVIEAALSAGLDLVPVALGSPKDAGKILDFGGKQIEVHGPSDREAVLSSTFKEYPDLIVVDYTVPAAVNENAALYCKVGVPFVMGTTGGDRDLLYKTVADSKAYAVISPLMSKQVVLFLATMEIMVEQFPGAFAGYKLQVRESHQASKLDISGTVEPFISCFKKLGASVEEKVQQIRDPKLQDEIVGVPQEYLSGHAFHKYSLTSPDGTVFLEFQHNVCGRSIYAEVTLDAIRFLAKKVTSKADKGRYVMIDVFLDGNMI